MNKLMAFSVASAGLVALVGVTAASADTSTDQGGQFHGVNPTRILDTRVTHNTIGSGKTLKLKVAGVGGIPTGITAVAVNLTATKGSTGGHLVVYPDGSAMQDVSALNYQKTLTLDNGLTEPVGSDGYVNIYNSAGTVDVTVDVQGYYLTAQSATVSLTNAAALNAGSTVLSHVGGRVGDPGFATPLTATVTLQPGTYEYTLYADFSRKAGTGSDNPAGNNTYGTAFLWTDVNGDNAYDWKSGEALGGTVQTGAVPVDPTGSIEQPANGVGVFTLTVPTKILVGGFAYNTNTGQYGTVGSDGAGDFSFLGANASFVKYSVG